MLSLMTVLDVCPPGHLRDKGLGLRIFWYCPPEDLALTLVMVGVVALSVGHQTWDL